MMIFDWIVGVNILNESKVTIQKQIKYCGLLTFDIVGGLRTVSPAFVQFD